MFPGCQPTVPHCYALGVFHFLLGGFGALMSIKLYNIYRGHRARMVPNRGGWNSRDISIHAAISSSPPFSEVDMGSDATGFIHGWTVAVLDALSS